jgi:RimJ/RimL family protein N-acetyltransferase
MSGRAKAHVFNCEDWLLPQLSGSGSFVLGARPMIKTERLVIRPFNAEVDRKAEIYAILDTPDIHAEYQAAGMGAKENKAKMLETLSRGVYFWPDSDLEIRRLDLVIELQSGNNLIGILHATEYVESGYIELGYAVAQPYRRQGCVTEAVKGFIDTVESRSGRRLFYAWIFNNNIPSKELIKKLGFINMGESNNEPSKCCVATYVAHGSALLANSTS